MTVEQAVFEWIRDDAPTVIKMKMTRELTDKLVARISQATEGPSE